MLLRVQPLNPEQKQQLENTKKNHQSDRPRKRAHGLLLSEMGYKVAEIAEIFGSTRQTVATWIKNWNTHGLESLFDAPRSGRPSKLSDDVKKSN